MNIIFHCGLPKTGTTSIQSYMHSMPKNNVEKFIYHPHGFKHGGIHHLKIAESLGCHPHFKQNLKALANYRETIKDTANSEQNGVISTLVFSCEVFSMNPCSDGFGTLLAKGLNELFGAQAPNVTYLFYIRDPISWAISMYNQLIRSGRISISPSVYAKNISDHFGSWDPDIHQLIKGYKDATKEIGGNVQIKPFSRNLLSQGDVVTDFLTTIGYEIMPYIKCKDSFNKAESIDARTIDVLLDYSKRINRQLTYKEARGLSVSLSRYFTGEKHCSSLFSSNCLSSFHEYFSPIYKSISRTFVMSSKTREFIDYCSSDKYLLAEKQKLISLLSL